VQLLFLWALLKRRLATMYTQDVLLSAIKALAAASLAGAAGYFTAQGLAPAPTASAWYHVFPGVLSGAVYVAVFVLGASLLKSPELSAVTAAIGRRWRR
jgi:hypothetical protein